MLVELEKTAKFPGLPLLAQIRTTFGHTAVRWCGAPHSPPARYHVEWAIDEEIAWGQNAQPAGEASPALGPGGHCVIIRGRLELTDDGSAILDLDGEKILLDLAEPIPPATAGSWVNLYLQRENIAVYPYQL